MHADDADLIGAEVLADVMQAGLEGEAEDDQPIGIPPVAAGFDGFGDGLLAHGAEFRADVQVGFFLAVGGAVVAFRVQGAVAEAVDAGEDGLLPLVAGFDAGALQVLEDEVLKRGQPAVLLPLPGQFLRGDRFVTLERLHGEGAGHAQALLVRLRLVIEGFLLGGLAIGDAAEGDVRDFL